MTRGLRSVLACVVLLGGGAALAQQDTMDRVGPEQERQAPGGPTPRPGQGGGQGGAAEEGTGGSGPAGQGAQQGEQQAEEGQGLPRLRPSERSQDSRQLGNDIGGTGDGKLGW